MCNAKQGRRWNADWYSIGYVDGARGYPASKIGEHRRACAEYSVRPDFGRYDEGRIAGLVEYCNPRNGYWLGTKGALYNGVCPKNLEEPLILSPISKEKCSNLWSAR